MALTLNLYTPNISKPQLQTLTMEQVGEVGRYLSFDIPNRNVRFRAPELALHLTDEAEPLLTSILHALLTAARILGGTKFNIDHETCTMRDRSITITAQQLEHVMIACPPNGIRQVNIF